MNLNWYSFKESYLQSIDYQITKCKLVICIDARMSIDHPKVNQLNSEQNFVNLKMVFEGIQYFRSINSSNLETDPNDDYGSIYRIKVKELTTVEAKLAGVMFDRKPAKLILDYDNGTIAEVYSNVSEIKFLDFISEMLAFRIGFAGMQVIENN